MNSSLLQSLSWLPIIFRYLCTLFLMIMYIIYIFIYLATIIMCVGVTADGPPVLLYGGQIRWGENAATQAR